MEQTQKLLSICQEHIAEAKAARDEAKAWRARFTESLREVMKDVRAVAQKLEGDR